jgi:hypothetical protein
MDDGLRLEGADEAGREERNDKESGEGEGKERGDNGGSQMLPRRVAIKVKVTDIEGEPVGRVPTMARIFASAVLKRNFNFDPNARPRDQMHFLPRFDSPNPVEAWFLYDFNYDDRVQQDLARIPHDVYLASFVNGIWYVSPLHSDYIGGKKKFQMCFLFLNPS